MKVRKPRGRVARGRSRACVPRHGDCRPLLCCSKVQISCGKCTSLSLPPRPFHPPLLLLWFPSRISSLHPLGFLLHSPHVWLTSLPLSYLWLSFSFQNSLLSCVCSPRSLRFPTNPLSPCCQVLSCLPSCIFLHQDQRMPWFCQQETQFLLQVTAGLLETKCVFMER